MQTPPIRKQSQGNNQIFPAKTPLFKAVFLLAGPKGFEPSVFSVTGRRVNRATPRTHDIPFVGITVGLL